MMGAVILRHGQAPEARIGHRVSMAVREHGAIVRNLGDAIVFMPALAMTPAQITRLGTAVTRGIRAVLG
jgi:adenosylmethionine-8-amino-7-oxononanoate aminotransferase